MNERGRHDRGDAPAVSAQELAALRQSLEAVVEVPPPLEALQAAAVNRVADDHKPAGIYKRDALQAGAAHRQRVRAHLLALDAVAPESALERTHEAAEALLRDELPRLAALAAIVEAGAVGDAQQVRQAIEAAREAQTIIDADRERLGAALRALSAAQPAMFASLALPERVQAAFSLDKSP